jgi:hypothetical protein
MLSKLCARAHLGDERLDNSTHDTRQNSNGRQERMRAKGRDCELLVTIGCIPESWHVNIKTLVQENRL